MFFINEKTKSLGLNLNSSKTKIKDLRERNHYKTGGGAYFISDEEVDFDPMVNKQNEKSLRVLRIQIIEWLYKYFNEDMTDFKDKDEFFEMRIDGALSNRLKSLREVNNRLKKEFDVEYDEDKNVLNLLFRCLDDISSRAYVYANSLKENYGNNSIAQEKLFSILDDENPNRTEWYRNKIYLAMQNQKLSRERLKSLFDQLRKEDIYALINLQGLKKTM